MISNHLKKGLWLWIASGVGLWVASKQAPFQQYADHMGRIATLGLWGGVSILLIALLIVHHIEKSRSGMRLNRLYSRVLDGETVEIRGDTGIVRLIVLLMFAGIVLAALSTVKTWQYYVLCAMLLLFALILAAREVLTIIPLLRQPILRISREGLESPVFGKLAWRDIDGVEMNVRRTRTFTFHSRLCLLVLRLPRLTQQLHSATRLQHRVRSLFLPSDKLYVRLLRSSETPKAILTLCQRLSSNFSIPPLDPPSLDSPAATTPSVGT